jgi:predicted phosphodiesterase
MYTNRVAVISDIHGNRWALEAVLRDIACKGIPHIVNLGDSLYGPLDPAGSARILVERDLPAVRGNEDRIVVEPPRGPESATLRYVRESLAPEHLRWLASLPLTRVVQEVFFLCHGTPERDDAYLLAEVTQRGVHLRAASALQSTLSELEQPVIFCGHDHLPRTVSLPGGNLIVNPGSVGLPAYTDDVPHPHVIETGTPHARYSVVAWGEAGWRVEDVAVPYDWETAATIALQNGRPDWARWLRTGRVGAA